MQCKLSNLIVIGLTLASLTALPTNADELTDSQKQQLNNAQTALKQVTTNLALAQSSAGKGTSKPTGSKAKLTQVRLASAAQNVPTVKKLLADLPSDHADVKLVQTNLDSAEQAIATLQQRLSGAQPLPVTSGTADKKKSGGTDPTSGKSTATESSASPVKMGYQQIDLLKAANFNLREVESGAAVLGKLQAELQPVQDQLSINHRTIRNGLETLQNARRKSGFTQDGLDQLPANGKGVAETASRLAKANAQLDAAEQFLTPVHAKLTALIDPANYPEFQNDLKRLTELAGMYRDPMVFQTDRPRAADVVKEAEPAKTEAIRIAETYSRLIEQQTEQGKKIAGSSNNFLSKLEKFMAAAGQERQSLPGQIKKDLAQADEMATAAVTNQKPLFFTGGIPQVMGFAQEKIDLYTLLAPNKAPAIVAEFNQVATDLRRREKSLEALIIRENNLPTDRYQGTDRDQIVAVAIDAWKHQQAEFEVLASRIPSDAWARETKWRYSNGSWYFVDRSKLQVQLIIADVDDNSLAIIRPVTIIKDHQKGDSLIGTPMYAGSDALQPSAYLLRDKIK